jgi:hypothetical protein
MTYAALIQEEHERRANEVAGQPVRKTGLMSFHDRISARLKGGR